MPYDVQENFLRFIIEGKREYSNEEIKIRMKSIGMKPIMSPYTVVSIAPEYQSFEWDKKDYVIQDFQNYIEENLKKTNYDFFIITNAYCNVQIILSANSVEILSFFKKLREKISKEKALSCFIGIGCTVFELNKIFLSAKASYDMLALKYQYAEQGVASSDLMVQQQYNTILGADIVFERVIGCFLDGNLPKMAQRMDELVDHVRVRPNVSKSSIRRILIELTIRIINIASNANINVDKIIGDRDIYHWIMNQGHTENITSWILELSGEFIEIIQHNNSSSNNRTIAKACIYIDRNLGSTELSLQSVSDYVGLSSNYFSHLFAKEKGMGFNIYIVKQRMNKAKYLLEKSELKIENIALQTGFSRVQYFTKVFKQQVGITPSEFRKNVKKM